MKQLLRAGLGQELSVFDGFHSLIWQTLLSTKYQALF